MAKEHSPGTFVLIERLKAYWLKHGLTIRPGASVQEVKSFESRYQVCLPTDLREFYITMDGMEDGGADPDMFTFLRLVEVRAVTEELAHFGGIPDYRDIVRSLPEPHRWFVIVDYLITSAVYAIRLGATDEATPVVWIGGGSHVRVVASSFSGFVEVYLANPYALL